MFTAAGVGRSTAMTPESRAAIALFGISYFYTSSAFEMQSEL